MCFLALPTKKTDRYLYAKRDFPVAFKVSPLGLTKEELGSAVWHNSTGYFSRSLPPPEAMRVA